MVQRIVSALKGVIASVVLVINVVVIFSAMIPAALIKLILPFKPVRRVTDAILNQLATWWVSINTLWIRVVQAKPWKVSGMEVFKTKGWYLVSSNHQSWVDILVLQSVFNGRIPFLKFFIKQELIYVPIMGLAWWALDFPFMRRKGGGSVAKDLEAARKACEKFRIIPTSVISFLEGTRYTAAKSQKQGSPYKHLLRPKVGGIAMALETMGDKFDALLDVTIVYPSGVPGMWDLLSGNLEDVIVTVRAIPIPQDLRVDNGEDATYRSRLQSWISELWARKDREIAELSAQHRQAAQFR